MALCEAVVLVLIGLILTPGYLFYFDVTPKTAALLAGTAGLLIIAARRRDAARGPRLITLLLLGNAASLALSTALSPHRALSFYGSTWRSFGAVVQCAAMLFAWLVAREAAARPDSARIVLRGVAISGLVSSMYGIAQYFGWDPWIPAATYRFGAGVWTIVRPPGTLGYSSYFATWLLMSVFLSLALAEMESRRPWRLAARAAAVLSLAAMLLSGTRAAIPGILAGCAVWLWWRGFRLPRRAAGTAAVVALCGAGFYYSPPGGQLRTRSRSFREDPWGGARTLLWRDSLWMAASRPLAGYGPEVFLGEFPRFESKALAAAYPDFVHESPHNILLDALVSQGLPGLLLLCGLCAAGLAAAWRLKAGWLAAALAAGLVSQQFTAFTMPTAVLFLTTVALAVGLDAGPGEPRRSAALAARGEARSLTVAALQRTESAEPRTLASGFWDFYHWLPAGAAPVLVLALLYLAIRFTMADRALAVTRQLLEARDLRAATAEYEVYWFWHLPGTSADVWYSRSWLEVARSAREGGVVEQAVAISAQAAARATGSPEEPFAAWYNLAQVSAMRDDYGATGNALRHAIAAHPNWFKPHWMLAQQLELESRPDDALLEATVAAELDGGHHPEVAQTLADIRTHQTGAHTP